MNCNIERDGIMCPIRRKMEDTTEHVLQFGTELEDSEQYRLHNNTEKELEKTYIYLEQTEGNEKERKGSTKR